MIQPCQGTNGPRMAESTHVTIDRGPQVRAAQGWAGLLDDEMAQRLGVSKRTLSRLKNGAEVSYERRQAIVAATGVPAWFMDSGFAGVAGPEKPAVLERLETLEHQMDTIFRVGLNRTAGGILEERRAEGEDSQGGRSTDRQD